jgi:hypothetical protein
MIFWRKIVIFHTKYPGANKNTMNIKAKEYRKTLNTSQGRIQDFKLGGGGRT